MEKHNHLSGALVERAYADAAARYAKAKDADRAARRELHRVAGAFFSREEARRAEKLLSQWPEGGDEVLSRILALHASTRERLPLSRMDALYEKIFAIAGRLESVLDLACGLNPLYLGARGIRTVGLDISGQSVNLVNNFAASCGAPVRAVCADLLCEGAMPEERFDLALLFKALPLLERQRAGSAAAVMSRANARALAVSFPTRTLGGRDVGMERHYAEWMEARVPEGFAIAGRFADGNELFYILKEG